MSNRGLEKMLGKAGIDLHRVAVGDRYILEKMRNDLNKNPDIPHRPRKYQLVMLQQMVL